MLAEKKYGNFYQKITQNYPKLGLMDKNDAGNRGEALLAYV